MGATVFSNSFGVVAPVCTFSDSWLAIFQLIACGISNFAFFFTLMTVSSSFGLVGIILVTPLAVGLLWIIASWARGTEA